MAFNNSEGSRTNIRRGNVSASGARRATIEESANRDRYSQMIEADLRWKAKTSGRGKKEWDRIDHSVRRCRDVERLGAYSDRPGFFTSSHQWNPHFFPMRRNETRRGGAEKRAEIG